MDMLNTDNDFLKTLPVNDLNLYVEMGNEALKKGSTQKGLDWYYRGLRKAMELCNKEKEREIRFLIMSLI